jgi:deazaflavin-dependent oxidoreductase (nitroreductase family)
MTSPDGSSAHGDLGEGVTWIEPDRDVRAAAHLEHVDPTRPPTRFGRAYASVATTSVAKFASRHVNWKLDPLLLRLTRGRLATTLVFPTALLETQGVRSGARRRNAIIYFHDGERITIAASNAGASHHPAWYHNLRAHPNVTFGGTPMRATVVDDETERVRLWALADRVFPAFPRYRHDAAKAGRTIPLIQLTQRWTAEGPRNLLDDEPPGEHLH